jgi:bacterioferritin-associated ferredoxin
MAPAASPFPASAMCGWCQPAAKGSEQPIKLDSQANCQEVQQDSCRLGGGAGAALHVKASIIHAAASLGPCPVRQLSNIADVSWLHHLVCGSCWCAMRWLLLVTGCHSLSL